MLNIIIAQVLKQMESYVVKDIGLCILFPIIGVQCINGILQWTYTFSATRGGNLIYLYKKISMVALAPDP